MCLREDRKGGLESPGMTGMRDLWAKGQGYLETPWQVTSGVCMGLVMRTCLDLPVWGIPRLVHSRLMGSLKAVYSFAGLAGFTRDKSSGHDRELRPLVIEGILGRGAGPRGRVGVPAKGEGSGEEIF